MSEKEDLELFRSKGFLKIEVVALFYHDDPFLTKILIFKIRGDFLKIVV